MTAHKKATTKPQLCAAVGSVRWYVAQAIECRALLKRAEDDVRYANEARQAAAKNLDVCLVGLEAASREEDP